MNDGNREIIDGYIREAGALVPRKLCGDHEIRTHNKQVELQITSMALNDWTDGVFRNDSKEKILREVSAALDDLHVDCPGCSQKGAIDHAPIDPR